LPQPQLSAASSTATLNKVSVKRVTVKIDDELRLSIAEELKNRIEKALKPGVQNLYSPSAVLGDDQIDQLCSIANKIQKDKFIEKNLDVTVMCGLLLFMMLSREQPNIEEKDLAWIDESNDFSEFNGFFRDLSVKALFVSPAILTIVGCDGKALHGANQEEGSKAERRRAGTCHRDC
jgi:hypothetical protein